MPPRPIAKVFTTPHFERSYRDLSPAIRKTAVIKDQWFRADAFDARLRTHPLRGKLKGLWAYSVNHGHRVLFEFTASSYVLYHDIGSHSIYK